MKAAQNKSIYTDLQLNSDVSLGAQSVSVNVVVSAQALGMVCV